MKQLFSLIIFFSFVLISFGQEVTWGGKRINTVSMFLDPNEIQMFGSITQIEYDPDSEIKEFGQQSKMLNESSGSIQYIPFGFGGSQSIVSKTLSDKKASSWEILGEFGVATQFEWRHMDSGGIQRNMLNSDFRIAFSYIRHFESSSYRVRFFHVSTHIGDDFIIRHGINKYTPTNMNFEQLDFSYFKDFKENHSWYLGLGTVVQPNSDRASLSYLGGMQLNWKKNDNSWGWTVGTNIKGHQETDFTPNLKLAAGPAYFSSDKDEPIRVVLEYYLGHLPYSQYETQKVSWIGAGIYFYL